MRWLVLWGVWLWGLSAVAAPREELAAKLQTGDVVLHTSRSRQSQAIRAATHSALSHVGLVEVTAQGVFVVEAVQPVQRVPFSKWKARGVKGHILVLRPQGLDAEQRQRALTAAKSHLGKPYDWRFGWGDEAMYCSELVRKAYAQGAGVEYGAMEALGSLDVAGLKQQMRERYGAQVPLEQELITPASLARDARLSVVHSDFPSERQPGS
ncbi:YiiX family permuted papain-like enzyme [Myxococcus sp. CA051A]|uniref:YiiX family permuted papain-like enzyme n=1 Tax=unclassified Myxococcus TaxID=2648731 RepID=UPI00157A3A09|nr:MULTISPECIES: YiiX family permuted papain-like enzyme [unclassified Myxococcus]NTX11496.1 YiiX family permuted papain-like enzyme [Myxococcus sp. CA056]NTX60767.1 YiiX family permuted papain-like enzyme [Myxococcus sp. CA051A]